MRFAVPQFIDVEDKILGPLTLKQGIYLLGAGGATYLFFAIGGFLLAFLLGGGMIALAVMFAFIKVNNRPFSAVAAAAFFYYINDRLYLWKKVPKKQPAPGTQATQGSETQKVATPVLTQSKLSALAYALDSEEGYVPEEG